MEDIFTEKNFQYLPVKETERLPGRRHYGETFKAGKYVVKRASKLWILGPSYGNLTFECLEDACLHVKFYKFLVKKGVFHPDTDFLVCGDEDGKLTMLAVMPFFKEEARPSGRLRKTVERNLKILKDMGVEPYARDVGAARNYMRGSDGDYYLVDLHIAHNCDSLLRIPDKILSKYVKRF